MAGNNWFGSPWFNTSCGLITVLAITPISADDFSQKDISNGIMPISRAADTAIPDYLCTINPDIVAAFQEGSYPVIVFSNTQLSRSSEVERACFIPRNSIELTSPPAFSIPAMKYRAGWWNPWIAVEGDQGLSSARLLIFRDGRYYIATPEPCPVDTVGHHPFCPSSDGTFIRNIWHDLADQPGAIHYEISGSATYGIDYENVRTDDKMLEKSGTLEFAAGEVYKAISIDILNDLESEDDETIEISFSEAFPHEYEEFFRNQQPSRITLLDDDRLNTVIGNSNNNSSDIGPFGAYSYECYFSNGTALEAGSTIYDTYFTGSSATNIFYEHSDELPIEDAVICRLVEAGLPASVPIFSSPVTPPPDGQPVIDSIIPADSSLIVSFSNLPPATDVIVSCTPASGGTTVEVQGSSSPIRVDGLTNGIEYQCRVTTDAGSLLSAAVSASPRAAQATGIPIISSSFLALLSALLGLLGISYRRKSNGRAE